MSDRPIVVVGAGQAGGRLAATLRELGHQGRIVLIGQEPHMPYERPPLSKEILTGKMTPEEACLGDDGYWSERRIELRLGSGAVALDPRERVVTLATGEEIDFEDLVFATGATPRWLPGVPEDDGRVGVLRTIEDAQALRDGLSPGAHLAIVGAGVIGLEVAASLREIGVEVTIFEAANRVMGRAVTEEVGRRLARMHEAAGVALRFGVRIESVESGDGDVTLRLAGGDTVAADRLLVAVGVQPNDELAEDAGIPAADGILVDALGRTGVPRIWAVGDVARHPADWSDDSVRQETWRHADMHSRAVAAAILGQGTDYVEVPGFWSDQYGHRFQSEGVPEGQEMLRDDGDAFTALYFAPDGRLLGCAVLDAPKVAALARRAIAARKVFDPAAFSDSAADLRRLLKS